MLMNNYVESSVTGQIWTRCCQIAIENRRGQVPTVRFEEERVVVLEDGDEMRKPAAGVTLDFDPAREVPLRNPVTGEMTGQVTTYAAIYATLYSAYIAAAVERDAPPKASEEPTSITQE